MKMMVRGGAGGSGVMGLDDDVDDKFEEEEGLEFPQRDERVPQWSQQETRDLIAIRAELERDLTVLVVSNKRNKTLWETVSLRMKGLGYRRTSQQCKCKWKNLLNRYKGKETSDQDGGRQFPFFEELHAIFKEREMNMQQMLVDTTKSGGLVNNPKKRAKRITGNQSPDYLSNFEDEEEEEEEEEKEGKGQRDNTSIIISTPRKRKDGKGKNQKGKEKATGHSSTGNHHLNGIQDLLKDFLQQQQRIEMMWRESIEKNAYERRMFEQEWRHSMEKIERERLIFEQAWRDRDDQRRMREDSRAEKRDALLTTLLNKLVHETDHP